MYVLAGEAKLRGKTFIYYYKMLKTTESIKKPHRILWGHQEFFDHHAVPGERTSVQSVGPIRTEGAEAGCIYNLPQSMKMTMRWTKEKLMHATSREQEKDNKTEYDLWNRILKYARNCTTIFKRFSSNVLDPKSCAHYFCHNKGILVSNPLAAILNTITWK